MTSYFERRCPEKWVDFQVWMPSRGRPTREGMGGCFTLDVLAASADIIVSPSTYRFGARSSCMRAWHSQWDGSLRQVTLTGFYLETCEVGEERSTEKGLFRYAIMQSGSPLAYWALLHPPATTVESTKSFVKNLGCTRTHDMALVKECLKKIDAWYINNAFYKHAPGLYNYSPVVDGEFILAPPEEALMNLSLNGQAFMTGITQDEGSLTTEVVLKSAEKVNQQFRFDEDYPKDYTPPPVQAFSMIPGIEHLVFHEYKPWHDPDNKTANLVGFSHVVGDSTFVAPAIKLARLLSRRSKAVFFYTFNHVSALSSHPLWMGVPHGVDLFYLFGCPLSGHPMHQYDELDKNVSRTFIDLWANFVKHGYPFLSSRPQEPFPAFEDRNQSYFMVASTHAQADIRVGRRLRSRQVAFWNNLLPKLRRQDAPPGGLAPGNAVAWVFVALSSVLLVVVVILSLCVLYFKKLARDRCIVHANDEKSTS
ncbi:hypothetical protein C0Q70_16004 [Pomacea canaliculata]|uniref:Carboxylesterase type B domain-containing protein n=1 Tax=Pomacea canaliculata TaxID=400727 RepID=A0A2T7NNK3_POMCA|nr:hypothetical protein C0Q70_16004 [Pomacea canaliculata]